MKEKLLPCPFCGNEPNETRYWDESLFSHNSVEYLSISCFNCDIMMSSEQQEEVTKQWNTRFNLATFHDSE